MRAAGHEMTAIGKLHFRSADDDNGFTEEIMPLHVVDGIGDPMGWLRDPLPVRRAALRLAADAGRGNSSYQDYDDRITAAAIDWLKARAAARSGKPWVLFVSLVCPHFPLIARDEWYDLYPEAAVPWPALYAPEERPDDRDLPGASLFDVARGVAPRRTILSEYHATGAATGAFMIRKGPFKYVYYAGMPPQLFDLDADPQETRDLAADPGYRGLLAQCEAELRLVVDPDAADALAKADQRARIAAFGGREAILARGSFGYSPTPGTKPVYN